METVKLGISACLLGKNVRYDGGHKLDRYLTDTLGKFVQWVPVCPEVESGLPVPREAMRLLASPEGPRLVTRGSGIDHTERMLSWSRNRLDELEGENLCGFVFKSRSPSSGLRGVKIYNSSEIPFKKGPGLFGGSFAERFPLLPMEDEGRLQDPNLRENFIERVFVFSRWLQLTRKKSDVVRFHTDHKLLVLSHSPRHYSLLGRLVADAKKLRSEGLHSEYLRILMEGLKMLSTSRKNINVLMHMIGYFKKELSTGDKKELLDIIGQYRAGYIPVVVPLTLIRHYVYKYDKEYLKRQYYLQPHPAELMLRNHA